MGDSPNESEEEDEEEDEGEEAVFRNAEPSSNLLEQQVPPELPLENNASFGRSEAESMDVDGVSANSIADSSVEQSPLIPLEGQETPTKKSAKKKVRKEVLYEEIDVSSKVH